MKKTLLIAIIFLGLIVGVSGAKALTSDEVEMLITVLNLDSTRAATLRGMATTPAVRTNCYVFNRNVKINDSNPDVLELTKSLKILGYLESTSGTFDENVAAAVVKYQGANGIIQTGYVGPLTRGSLNSSTNCRVAVSIPGTIPVATPVPTPYIYPVNPTIPSDGTVSANAILVSANKDQVYKWNGSQVHSPDWGWEIDLTNKGSATKYIKSILILHNASGEGWSTEGGSNNPLGKVLRLAAVATCETCGVFNQYNENISVALNPANTKSLYLYGEPASHTFSGGKAVVYFTDGTSMTVVIPASSLTPSLTTTTKSFTGLTVTSPNGGSYDSTGQLNVQWTSYVGDFDYYQIMLGNNIANSEVEMGDGMQISKYQNSYNTFAISSFVDKIISNSGMSRDVIKDAYYVKVNAVKLDRVSGGIMNTGKSNIFSIRSLDVYYSVKSSLINYVTVSQNGGAVSQLQLGNTYSIKWNETNTSGNTQVTLQQIGNTLNTVMIISTLNSVGNGTNSTSFTMPTSFSPVSGATYKIWVQSGNVGGEQMVSFANTSVTQSPLITTLSPNGGETFTYDYPYIPVTWNTNFAPSSVKVYLYSPVNGSIYESPIITSNVSGKQSTNIPMSINYPGGQYKVNVCDDTKSPVGLAGKSLCDISDNYFTVASSSIVINQSLIKVSISVISGIEDKVGAGIWTPGKGVISGTVGDWRWALGLDGSTLPAGSIKKVSSITVIRNNSNEGWSTSISTSNPLSKALYPLKVIGKGIENTAYDQDLGITLLSGQNINLDLYGQIEGSGSTDGYVIIKFTDGTSITTNISRA